VITVRPAHESDLTELGQRFPPHRQILQEAVRFRTAYLGICDGETAGFAIFDYSFYHLGFLSLLFVLPQYRHKGVASALMHFLEQNCTTPKLFTSTNLSNLPMQALLVKRGYLLAGIINHLDEGDPELVYVKILDNPSFTG
jgi:GNAT superfamily N-acetyltransferase